MSNTERQRKFRAANPGYFNKYNNRRKAQRIAGQKWALGVIKENAKAKAAALQQQQQQQQPAPPLTLPPKPVLMLPAPVRDPAMDGARRPGRLAQGQLRPPAAARRRGGDPLRRPVPRRLNCHNCNE